MKNLFLSLLIVLPLTFSCGQQRENKPLVKTKKETLCPSISYPLLSMDSIFGQNGLLEIYIRDQTEASDDIHPFQKIGYLVRKLDCPSNKRPFGGIDSVAVHYDMPNREAGGNILRANSDALKKLILVYEDPRMLALGDMIFSDTADHIHFLNFEIAVCKFGSRSKAAENAFFGVNSMEYFKVYLNAVSGDTINESTELEMVKSVEKFSKCRI